MATLLKQKDQKANQNETTVAYQKPILYQSLEESDPSWQHSSASDGHLDAQIPTILFYHTIQKLRFAQDHLLLFNIQSILFTISQTPWKVRKTTLPNLLCR